MLAALAGDTGSQRFVLASRKYLFKGLIERAIGRQLRSLPEVGIVQLSELSLVDHQGDKPTYNGQFVVHTHPSLQHALDPSSIYAAARVCGQ